MRSKGRRGNVLAAAASGIQSQVERDGGDPDEVLAMAGLNWGLLGNSRTPVDLASYVSMLEIAAGHTGNENFGLDYGKSFTPDRLGLIGAIVLTSPTLGSALANMASLFPYHQQATEIRLIRERSMLRLDYRILDGTIVDRRQDAELTLGMFANMFRWCLGPDWVPDQVYCEHPRPGQWRDVENAFQAPAHFGQRTNSLIFWHDDLDAPMPDADLRKFAKLQEELRAVSGGVGKLDLVSRVSSEIRSALPEGGIGIEEMSEIVMMPRWTLQRRLSQLGMTYSGMVDLVRKEMAERYLRQLNLSVTDIAFLLGFSELSAFSRACRRWFDASPQLCRHTWCGS